MPDEIPQPKVDNPPTPASGSSVTKSDTVSSTSLKDDIIRANLAYLTVLCYFGFSIFIVWLLVFHGSQISEVTAAFIGTVIGSQFNNAQTVYNYMFGSSSGSTAKSAMLETKKA